MFSPPSCQPAPQTTPSSPPHPHPREHFQSRELNVRRSLPNPFLLASGLLRGRVVPSSPAPRTALRVGHRAAPRGRSSSGSSERPRAPRSAGGAVAVCTARASGSGSDPTSRCCRAGDKALRPASGLPSRCPSATIPRGRPSSRPISLTQGVPDRGAACQDRGRSPTAPQGLRAATARDA